MGTIQPLVDRFEDLADAAGVSGQELMAGCGGHEETAVVMDAWACSRGRLTQAEFARYVPLRGVGKVTFPQALDVARAAARRLGEDTFQLTFDEVRRGVRDPDLVAERRALRERYQKLEIPGVFAGTPAPVVVAADTGDVLHGIAAGPGVVEGPCAWSPTRPTPTSRAARSSSAAPPTPAGRR